MGKAILIVLGICVGLLGLLMSACGILLIINSPGAAIAIGLIPGGLLLWLAYWLLKRARLQRDPTDQPTIKE